MSQVQMVTVVKDDNDIRLDRWFKRNFPKVSHISVEKALRKGQIRVDGQKVKSSHKVQEGSVVRVPPMVEYTRQEKPKKQIDEKYIKIIQDSVIYKDAEIIVINKPAGLAVQGGVGVDVCVDVLLDFLKFDYEQRPKIVHRLDKDTSGVLVLARKTNVAAKLSEMFRSKEAEKIYWSVVIKTPKIKEGKINMPLLKRDTGAGKEKVVYDEEGQNATTFYRVMDDLAGKVSLVELRPITGRTHQLRVHMSEVGHPILGDGKYGGKEAFIDGLSKKMHLHARSLKLPNKPLFTADLTGDMKKTILELELDVNK